MEQRPAGSVRRGSARRGSARRTGGAAVGLAVALVLALAGCATKEAPGEAGETSAPASGQTEPAAPAPGEAEDDGESGEHSFAQCPAAIAAVAKIDPAIQRAAAQLDGSGEAAAEEFRALSIEFSAAVQGEASEPLVDALETASGRSEALATIAAQPASPERMEAFGTAAEELRAAGDRIQTVCQP